MSGRGQGLRSSSPCTRNKSLSSSCGRTSPAPSCYGREGRRGWPEEWQNRKCSINKKRRYTDALQSRSTGIRVFSSGTFPDRKASSSSTSSPDIPSGATSWHRLRIPSASVSGPDSSSPSLPPTVRYPAISFHTSRNSGSFPVYRRSG